MNKPTLIHIVTVPDSLATFFNGQVRFMKNCGLNVQAIASPGKLLKQFAQKEDIPSHSVAMPRRISPLRDFVSIFTLCRILLKTRPQIVHAHTPKAGLLGMIAAWLCGVPIRVYHIRGLPFVTATGVKYRLLRLTEKISCGLAHQVLCVSHSLRETAIENSLCNHQKIKVLNAGSGNGVDANSRFNPAKISEEEKNRIRSSFGISPDAKVIGFVGRIVRDKGILELMAAWKTLREEFSDLHLFLIGPFETRDSVPEEIKKSIQSDPRIHLSGVVRKMPAFYRAIDICVLPTYREGLPNVLLEAAAMARPVVATRVAGCVDVVVDGQTGLLVPVRNPEALASALKTYLISPSTRNSHGKAARRRVQEQFCPERVWVALHAEYLRLAKTFDVSLGEMRVATEKQSAA